MAIAKLKPKQEKYEAIHSSIKALNAEPSIKWTKLILEKELMKEVEGQEYNFLEALSPLKVQHCSDWLFRAAFII